MSNEDVKKLIISFAEWIKEECYYNITGYCVYDLQDSPDFQVDELFDYWWHNVKIKISNK
jgi:hypothetical protein